MKIVLTFILTAIATSTWWAWAVYYPNANSNLTFLAALALLFSIISLLLILDAIHNKKD